MTEPRTRPDHRARLAEVLETVRFVLLDFDGPVCDVFAGRPAYEVAAELRAEVADRHEGPLPAEATSTDDPLVIVREVAEFAPHLSAHIDTALRCQEINAVSTAAPTPGTVAFLSACKATGRPVVIVSNNSAPAISAYLDQHQLTPYIQGIQGREPGDPRLMKPHPHLLDQALTALDAKPADAVLIGDSTTDVEAARAAGVQVIGYVNKPTKLQTLSDADALTTDIHELAHLIAQVYNHGHAPADQQ